MIRVAKTAGFCFGVNRAVDMVYDLVDGNNKVATLGPIIHNQQLVDKLTQKGVRIIDLPSEAIKNEVVVIRSHGVGRSTYDDIKKCGIKYVDATCPYVAKIHSIVEQASNDGKTVIILGDRLHPEIIGIVGHVNGDYFIVADSEELQNLFLNNENIGKKECILVVQTTYNQAFWRECEIIAKKLYTKLKIFDTICKATLNRQVEAIEIAKLSDLMIIIGGRHSSNTKKLFQVCSDHAKSVMIETAEELKNLNLSQYDDFGVTAGASTPAYIIKEVLKTMSEILRNDENELDFATLLEQSLETEKIYNGKRVIGIVTNVSANEVHVDVGAKQAGIIPADEMTDNPQAKLEDLVKKGDEIELSVIKVNDQEGIVLLSKKRCDAQAGFENLKKAFENEEVLDGVVTDVVRGGVLVYTSNTKLFVPASQCSDKRIEDLATLLKTNVKLKVIEINEGRNRAKGSIKAVLSQGRKEAQTKFWDEAEIGKTYTGEVKSLTSYGAFVDLGGIDGMIHVTELSWAKIKHPSEVVKQGQTVEVYIKEMDKEKKRISLGYKNAGEDPWALFADKYKVDDVVNAKIVSFTAYGAFAEIMPGVDGLIHISQIANKRVEKIADVLKVGQDIQVKIIEIDADKKRVSLSMRALLAEEDQKKDKTEEATADETAAE